MKDRMKRLNENMEWHEEMGAEIGKRENPEKKLNSPEELGTLVGAGTAKRRLIYAITTIWQCMYDEFL